MSSIVYILWSQSLAKTYVGMTSDLNNRLYAHNHGIKGWTLRGRPWELVHQEKFPEKNAALQREKFFKTGAGRAFIKSEILSKVSR